MDHTWGLLGVLGPVAATVIVTCSSPAEVGPSICPCLSALSTLSPHVGFGARGQFLLTWLGSPHSQHPSGCMLIRCMNLPLPYPLPLPQRDGTCCCGGPARYMKSCDMGCIIIGAYATCIGGCPWNPCAVAVGAGPLGAVVGWGVTISAACLTFSFFFSLSSCLVLVISPSCALYSWVSNVSVASLASFFSFLNWST